MTPDENCTPVEITINAADRSPLRRIWTFVGYDEANYTYTMRGRELLSKLANLEGTPYAIRCHFLLCSGDGKPALKSGSTNVYTEDAVGNPVLDWKIIDRIFDTYRELGCVPFVELGFMPQALSTAPPEVRYDNPTGGGWRYPPRDYGVWGGLVASLIEHVVDRYGVPEVSRWYWELWNEPDVDFYWTGTIAEYCLLYDHTQAALHSVLPQAQLGGPATTNPGSPKAGAFLADFLAHCTSGTNAVTGRCGTRLDFISFHSKGGSFRDDGTRPTVDNLVSHVRSGLEIAARYGLEGVPVHISECDPDGWAAGCTEDGANFRHRNSEFYASYLGMTACRLLGIDSETDAAPANPVHSMLTWAFEFEGRNYFEGFRSLSTNGLDKPVLNTLRLLARLGDERLSASSSNPGVGVIASGTNVDSDPEQIVIRILVAVHEDDWDSTDPVDLRLRVSGLPAGEVYTVTVTRIDAEHANTYTAWLEAGSPQTPSEAQIAAIRKSGELVAEPLGNVVVEGGRPASARGSASVSLTAAAHSVCLVEYRHPVPSR